MLKNFFTLVYLLLSLIIGNEETGNGSEKKAKVIAQAKEMMGNFGIKLPTFLSSATDALLGLLVDMLVKYLNNNEVFDGITSTASATNTVIYTSPNVKPTTTT